MEFSLQLSVCFLCVCVCCFCYCSRCLVLSSFRFAAITLRHNKTIEASMYLVFMAHKWPSNPRKIFPMVHNNFGIGYYVTNFLEYKNPEQLLETINNFGFFCGFQQKFIRQTGLHFYSLCFILFSFFRFLSLSLSLFHFIVSLFGNIFRFSSVLAVIVFTVCIRYGVLLHLGAVFISHSKDHFGK